MDYYLDVAATAKYRNTDDIIIYTMTNAMRDNWMNPSSLYSANVKDKINKCRSNIADFIGAKSDEIYFTSGASESNSLAIRGWVDYELENQDFEDLKYVYFFTTPIEHKSILNSIGHVCMQTEMCSIDEYGRVNLKYLENSIKRYKGESILVSIHMANNEIGTIQDIRSISRLVHAYNGILHVDATQAFGHIPIDVNDLGIDMMSASGHKLSPVLRGIGFLYKKNGININPIIYGTQENGLRGGTENTYGIIGLNKAVEYCDIGAKNRSMISIRDYFIGSLEFKFGCKLNGHSTYRLPNNINVTFPQNITGENLLYMLDMSGIKISTGSACNSNSIEPSHVLEAIGLSDDEAMRTIRISLPYDITYDDVDKIISEIDKAIKIIES